MPYRVPSPPPSSKPKLEAAFWRERNDLVYDWQSIRSADLQIVKAIKRIATHWQIKVANLYPTLYPYIVDDIYRAAFGKGSYIRVTGASQHLLGVLVAALRLEGAMRHLPPNAAEALTLKDQQTLRDATKQAAIDWIKLNPLIEKVLETAFSQNASKLDENLTRQYPDVPGQDLLEGVYFRAVRQGDLIFFQSPLLSQKLFFSRYG